MSWTVLFHDDFAAEFAALAESLQDELLAHALLLRDFGPGLGRPTVDTLKGSKHANMKELRFGWAGEVWRVAFAFDPARQAILLVIGSLYENREDVLVAQGVSIGVLPFGVVALLAPYRIYGW